ncbi:retinol dehydrogenase 11-like [Penaeus chinensis]|uniref:retinol dehydrogenase 11-like n=1 Tax=Penaeus chinensis TaxID=139456 RepID=UPI001FB632DB|nr:retinol dehydrogenase 11-like [Penaeus chinensis]
MRLLLGVGRDSSLWFPILLAAMGTVGIVVGVAVGIYLIRKYRESKWGKCKSKRRMEGKIVVITGANSGIGKETARDLASRGAIVILACRNRQAALEAVKDIRTTTGDGDLIVMDLDLGDLASIRTFASNFMEKFSKLDVLINNGGVFIPPEERRKTKDGFEVHFGVNHLGHFLLTHLLFHHIQRTPSSRIVNVSSLLYKCGKIDFDNLDADKGWDKKVRHNALYCNSKLANIFHSQELAKRLQGTGTGVFVLCPGFVYTGLMRYSAHQFNWFKKLCFAPIVFLFMRTPKQGAQTTIHCAVSEELDGVEWGFLRECKVDKLEAVAEDPDTAAKLWDVSMALVGEGGSGSAALEDDNGFVEGQDAEAVMVEEEAVLVEDIQVEETAVLKASPQEEEKGPAEDEEQMLREETESPDAELETLEKEGSDEEEGELLDEDFVNSDKEKLLEQKKSDEVKLMK